ncbi:MAG: hypothetical protein MUP11_01270, partial [Anaerolineales bacterium]|nr:hypothetical protein [Anaerolineales bacterium]
VNIRTALVNDYLSPARQLWNTLGTNQYRNTMAIFGFSLGADPCPDCTIFPESPALEMVDLAQGYGVFVNQGYLRGKADGTSNLEIQPAAVLRIEAHSGEPLTFENTVVEKKIISEELAYLLNHILSDEIARTESSYADVFQIGRTAGVKVGAVPGSDSGWVIGYTQQIVTAVWAGSPDGEDLDVDTFQVTSSLWRAITQYTSRDQTSEDWDSPQGIVTLDVCYPSGMLPTEYCPRIVREVFIQGNEPQGVDTLFQAIQVNRETGLLASVFTTSPQIEERVYLNVPTEAKEWAEKAGIDIPPTLYDLENLDQTREDFTFVTPNNLSFVNGQVRITGTIPEDEFVSARLQSGIGMNPRSWIQIGAEITSPGDNRRLGIWDTTELNDGIYALQLVVIKERQQIEKVSLVVSVDNTPPEMALKTDFLEGDIPYLAGKEILFEVDFENNSEIQQVDFYLNDDLLATRRVPPYIHAWPLTLGEFELIVVATDQANNQTELSISFEVIRE